MMQTPNFPKATTICSPWTEYGTWLKRNCFYPYDCKQPEAEENNNEATPYVTLSALGRFQLLNPCGSDWIVDKSEYVMLTQLNGYISNTIENQIEFSRKVNLFLFQMISNVASSVLLVKRYGKRYCRRIQALPTLLACVTCGHIWVRPMLQS